MAELQPSHVLVTGAEGLVGTAVVARLLAYGHPVTTLSLPDALVHPDVRVVRGDATDAETVGRAVEGVDAVIHLAAFPSPGGRPAPVTFGNNALATFTVLWTAAEAGVRRFAVASSVNAIGLLMNPKHPLPDRFPLDENTPTSIADPYSLSKQVDEHTLRAVCERFEASGVALRLPLVVPPQRGDELREHARTHVAHGAGEGWGWIDSRDAAEAFRLAVTVPLTGAHTVQLAARTTLQEVPTEELMDRWAPDVARAVIFEGNAAPIDTSRARELLGFEPRFDEPGLGEADTTPEQEAR